MRSVGGVLCSDWYRNHGPNFHKVLPKECSGVQKSPFQPAHVCLNKATIMPVQFNPSSNSLTTIFEMTKVMKIITYPGIDSLDQQDAQQTLGPPRHAAHMDACVAII